MPAPPHLDLRPVRPADDAFLYGLFAASNPDLRRFPWQSAAERDRLVRQQFDAQRRQYRARYPGSDHEIVRHVTPKGTPRIGRLWTDRAASELRILDLNVLPAYEQRGFDFHLGQRLKAEAKGRGVPLRVRVPKHFDHAMRLFHHRLGLAPFEDTGTHIHLQWHPAMDRLTPGSSAAGIVFSSR